MSNKVVVLDREDEVEDQMSAKVYHVANPTVPGTVMGHYPNAAPQTAHVLFFQPVGFSGNRAAGKRMDWFCNPDLLYSTSEEAQRNHKPK